MRRSDLGITVKEILMALGGFLVLGVSLILFFGELSWIRPNLSRNSLLVSVLYCVPLAAFALVLSSSQMRKIDRIDSLINDFIFVKLKPVFEKQSVSTLFVIAVMSGLGEEILFRGFIQNATSLWVAALIFAAFHFASFILVLILLPIGVYLGFSYQHTGSIVTPILGHAVLNFTIFLRYLKIYQKGFAKEQSS